MLNSDKYEYVNQTTIDRDLLCTICGMPFVDPRCLSCSHVFCFKCLMQNDQTKSTICPICHKPEVGNTSKQINRPLQNMLDRLQVKCKQCEETGLIRVNFDDHINTVCLKTNVTCSCADIDCPWLGPRTELNKHLIVCPYQMLRPKLLKLTAEIHQLKGDLNEQKARNVELEKKSQEDNNRISAFVQEIRQLKGPRNRMRSSNSTTYEDNKCAVCKKDGCQNGRLPSYGYANLAYVAFKPTSCPCDCHK